MALQQVPRPPCRPQSEAPVEGHRTCKPVSGTLRCPTPRSKTCAPSAHQVKRSIDECSDRSVACEPSKENSEEAAKARVLTARPNSRSSTVHRSDQSENHGSVETQPSRPDREAREQVPGKGWEHTESEKHATFQQPELSSSSSLRTGLRQCGGRVCPSTPPKSRVLRVGGDCEKSSMQNFMKGSFDNIPPHRVNEYKQHLKYIIGVEEQEPAPAITAMFEVGEANVSLLVNPAWREGACKAKELILKRRLERAKEGEEVVVTLGQLRYSQESIKGFFCDGRPVSRMLSELHDGEKNIEDIPTISAVVHDATVYSLDNRRLWTFKHCGMSSNTFITVTAGRRDQKFFRKYTTPTGGVSVRRRCDNGFF